MERVLKDDLYEFLAKNGLSNTPLIPEFASYPGFEEQEEYPKINQVLLKISKDKELQDALRDYGIAVKFAEYDWQGEFYRGFSHLLLQPGHGLVIARRDITWPTFEFDENAAKLKTIHSKTFVHEGIVYFPRPSVRDNVPAVAEIRGSVGPICNYDIQRAPTAQGILTSLEDAVRKAH